ncbi:serine hydrolase [Pseudoduganella violaceinigra]|uniref:serine hydrolase n=1 Tax=Pseudoduganella violaceinigra TaxID=246602 RepID=UPI0004804A69|nr:serine hydrolase [Pseudoduganella violaceinigra]
MLRSSSIELHGRRHKSQRNRSARVSRYTPLLLPLCSTVHASELDAVTTAINAGEFKQVTSVVAAQHGKLVYEHYVDKDGADGLRNTRSVSKTITGMLAGLAVERNLLRADTPVLPCFPDLQPTAYADPHKNKINGRRFFDHEFPARMR